MSVRLLVLAVSAGFLVTSAGADNAQRRGGSSSSSSSAGARHHSPSSGGVQSSGRSSSGSSSSDSSAQSGGSSRSSRSSDRTVAERRHPRAGTGTGSWRGYAHYPGYYPGYYPGWYYPYWPSYYYGLSYAYGGWGPYGGYYDTPARAYYSYRTGPDTASLRVFGEPSKTRVFVDGYYAGVIDDFDGMFQRLHLSPGRHEIKFKLDGYRTHRVLVYVSPGQTLKLDHDMEKGAGEETFEDLSGGRGQREVLSERPPADGDETYDRPAPEQRRGDQPFRPHAGRLRLDIRPADASVYVDGQFRGTAGQLGELILPPGPHRIEVVRPGFRTEERDLDLDPGSSREITIELPRP